MSDYVALNKTQMFTPDQNQANVSIEIADDDRVESSENFTVRIRQVSMSGKVMSITSPTVTITIDDNDSKKYLTDIDIQ